MFKDKKSNRSSSVTMNVRRKSLCKGPKFQDEILKTHVMKNLQWERNFFKSFPNFDSPISLIVCKYFKELSHSRHNCLENFYTYQLITKLIVRTYWTVMKCPVIYSTIFRTVNSLFWFEYAFSRYSNVIIDSIYIIIIIIIIIITMVNIYMIWCILYFPLDFEVCFFLLLRYAYFPSPLGLLLMSQPYVQEVFLIL